MEKNPANGIKDLMWAFLMDKGQKENIPELKSAVYRLIQMTTQKTAGQRNSTHIDWDSLDMELMRIVIEATALVLSGRYDELEDKSNQEIGMLIKEALQKTAEEGITVWLVEEETGEAIKLYDFINSEKYPEDGVFRRIK